MNAKESGNFQKPGISQQGKFPNGIPMTAKETGETLLRQVADWDVPGNILYQAFHKPRSTDADSAVLGARRKPESPPGPPAPRLPSPGVPGASGGHRSGRSDFPHSNVSTDVPIQDPPVGPDTVWDGTSQHPVQEVLTRRSSRHRNNVVKFQAGSSGMENT